MIKLFKYRHIIIKTVILYIYYKLVFIFLSDKYIVRYLNKTPNASLKSSNISKNKIYNIFQKTIVIIAPSTSCLLKSFILNELFNHFGYRENIAIGIKKDGNSLNAHAWIEKHEFVPNYIKIH